MVVGSKNRKSQGKIILYSTQFALLRTSLLSFPIFRNKGLNPLQDVQFQYATLPTSRITAMFSGIILNAIEVVSLPNPDGEGMGIFPPPQEGIISLSRQLYTTDYLFMSRYSITQF